MGDDMFNPVNQSPTFRELIATVDCIFTSNSFNVQEFRAAGVSRVEYSPWAYDPEIHCPVALSDAETRLYGCDVAFIGTFRRERADFLDSIITGLPGLNMRIWGNWRTMRRLNYRFPRSRWPQLSPLVQRTELWCENYSKAIQGAGIVLGLLNHANRDLHTARSFEIPACGGFMIAERTEEHCQYFEEDREAVYFTGLEELIDKISFYRRNEITRAAVARSAYLRCIKSPYRYTDRAAVALEVARNMTGTVRKA